MRNVNLESICNIQIGKTPSRAKSNYWNGNLPWATISDLSNGRILTVTKEAISNDGADESGSKLIPAGTLLLSFKLSLGKRAIAGIDLFTNEAIAALLIKDPNVVCREYLYWALGTVDYDKLVDRAAKGKTLNKAKLRYLPVPLPPLAEQKRIAAILDAADALRARRREAIAQLDTLLQSTFLEMFGDSVTNPKRWEVIPITVAVKGKQGIKAGPFGSSLKKEDYSTSGYRVYGQEQVIAGRFDVGDYYINEKKYEKLKSCAVATGDILLSLVGSFGKVLVVPKCIDPGIINPRLLKITPRHELVTSTYLAALLQSSPVQRKLLSMSHGGTMGVLNAGLLKQLTVPLPPMDLQLHYQRAMQVLETVRKKHEANLAELNALFASLQSRAFKGEL